MREFESHLPFHHGECKAFEHLVFHTSPNGLKPRHRDQVLLCGRITVLHQTVNLDDVSSTLTCTAIYVGYSFSDRTVASGATHRGLIP